MNLKLYIRGLGIGLVAATIILTVAGKVQDNVNNTTQPETTSVSYFKTTQAATAEDTTGTSSEGTTAGEVTTAAGEGTTEPTGEAAAAPSETATASGFETSYEERPSGSTPAEIVTESATRQSNSAAVTATAYLPTNVTINKTTISFASVSSSEEAAQLLERSGVIEDWRAFNSYLEDNGYSRRISRGTFDLVDGDTFENIAKTITNSR